MEPLSCPEVGTFPRTRGPCIYSDRRIVISVPEKPRMDRSWSLTVLARCFLLASASGIVGLRSVESAGVSSLEVTGHGVLCFPGLFLCPSALSGSASVD